MHCRPPGILEKLLLQRQPHLTENVSSWIELVVFIFLLLLLFLLLLFIKKFFLSSPLCLGANVDLSIIVERLLIDLRG